MGGGVLSLLPMSLSRTDTQTDCDGGGDLLLLSSSSQGLAKNNPLLSLKSLKLSERSCIKKNRCLNLEEYNVNNPSYCLRSINKCYIERSVIFKCTKVSVISMRKKQ